MAEYALLFGLDQPDFELQLIKKGRAAIRLVVYNCSTP